MKNCNCVDSDLALKPSSWSILCLWYSLASSELVGCLEYVSHIHTCTFKNKLYYWQVYIVIYVHLGPRPKWAPGASS